MYFSIIHEEYDLGSESCFKQDDSLPYLSRGGIFTSLAVQVGMRDTYFHGLLELKAMRILLNCYIFKNVL